MSMSRQKCAYEIFRLLFNAIHSHKHNAKNAKIATHFHRSVQSLTGAALPREFLHMVPATA